LAKPPPEFVGYETLDFDSVTGSGIGIELDELVKPAFPRQK
jgi:hypothetical protein